MFIHTDSIMLIHLHNNCTMLIAYIKYINDKTGIHYRAELQYYDIIIAFDVVIMIIIFMLINIIHKTNVC